MSSRISVGFLLFEIPIRIFLKIGNLKRIKSQFFLAKQLDSNAYCNSKKNWTQLGTSEIIGPTVS